MSYKSKFTEIFDINPSYLSFQDICCAPPSPKSYSEEIPPEMNISDKHLSKSTFVKPIEITRQKRRDMPMTPPQSPPQNSEKHSDALSYKFKSFLNSISRKRDRSTSISPSASKVILTK